MALQLETAKIHQDITVVRVSGSMTFEEADALPSLMVTLLDHGAKKLILDLNGAEQIDRLGGVSLIRSYSLARAANAALCVASASISVTRLFQTMHLDFLIPSFPTVAAARDHLMGPTKANSTTA